MNLDHIRDRLQGVRGSGSSFMAKCPTHEDRSPSLSVKDAGDRVLINCHAGCNTEDVLSAIGLTWSDTFAETLKPIRPSLRVHDRRRLARSHEIEFNVLALAETAETEQDIRRVKQAESRLERLARQYGTEEFEQIAQHWETRDYVRR